MSDAQSSATISGNANAASSDVSQTENSAANPTTPPSKSPPPETPESIAAMKKAAHLKFEEARKLREEAAADKAAAQKEREEALSSKAQIEQFIELSSSNPKKLIQIYGEEKARAIAEELLYQFHLNEKLTPEQREERDRKAAEAEELENYRKDKKTREEEEAKRKKNEQIEVQTKHLDEMIAKTIEENGLAKTPRMVKRIAEYLDAQLDQGIDLDPSSIVGKAHAEIHADVVGLIKDMPIEQIQEEFPTLLERLREFDMKQAAKVPNFQSGFARPKPEEEKPNRPEMTIDEAFKRIG